MKWCVVCVFLACAVSWTCCVVNQPCNVAQTDCDPGECCSYVSGIARVGEFNGVCKMNLRLGDECTPEVTDVGQCRCSNGMSCVSVEAKGVSRCFYLPH